MADGDDGETRGANDGDDAGDAGADGIADDGGGAGEPIKPVWPPVPAPAKAVLLAREVDELAKSVGPKLTVARLVRCCTRCSGGALISGNELLAEADDWSRWCLGGCGGGEWC